MLSFLKRQELSEIIRAALVLLALALIAPVYEKIKCTFGLQDSLWLKAASVAAVFVGLVVMNLVLETRLIGKWLRNHELKKFEGLWAQNVTLEARPYSIAFINFNQKQKHWIYDGIGFGTDFRPAAEWHTISLYFNNDDFHREWFFSGEGQLRNYVAALGKTQLEDQKAHVLPVLKLPKNSVVEVDGTVSDIGIGGKRKIFGVTLKRAPSQFSNRLSSINGILQMKPDEVCQLLSESGVKMHS